MENNRYSVTLHDGIGILPPKSEAKGLRSFMLRLAYNQRSAPLYVPSMKGGTAKVAENATLETLNDVK